MSILYIKIENGSAVDHPVIHQNLFDVFDGVPDNYEPFIQSVKPIAGFYEVFEDPEFEYIKDGEFWTTKWKVRAMTPEEKLQKETTINTEMESMRVEYLATAKEEVAKETDPNKIAMWNSYIQAIESWKIVDFENPAMPENPRVLMNRHDLTMSGSSPTLIG